MRAVLITCLFFVAIALVWAIQTPHSAKKWVERLADPNIGAFECETALRRCGSSATLALREGLNSNNPRVELRCAKLLALQGETNGEDRLLTELHSSEPSVAGSAEQFLLSVWHERGAPPRAVRERLRTLQARGGRESEELKIVTENLSTHSAWLEGYILRARLATKQGDGMEARRNALIALMLEPEEFEAMTVLAQAYLLMNSPEQAYTCLEQAARVNPQIKLQIKDEIRTISKLLDAQKNRQRRERRKFVPIAQAYCSVWNLWPRMS